MKEFRIGQRVRCLRSKHYPDVVGRVGTITSALYHDGAGEVQRVHLEGVSNVEVWVGHPSAFEPIDEEKGDWSVIQHVTGWIPKEKVT
jgi:hypothetical protein